MTFSPGQMAEWGWLGAFGLGVLSATHPCPLATNAAALSLICAWGGTVRRNLTRGLLLVAGLCVTYVLLAAAIGHGVMAMPGAAGRLPAVIRPFLGPLVLMAGALLTGLFGRPGSPGWARKGAESLARLRGWGWIAPFIAGCVLALAFCPATAGLFFGVLLPMAVSDGAATAYAVAFGLGCGAPIAALSTAIALGLSSSWIKRGWVERVPAAMGWVLVLLGIYLTARML